LWDECDGSSKQASVGILAVRRCLYDMGLVVHFYKIPDLKVLGPYALSWYSGPCSCLPHFTPRCRPPSLSSKRPCSIECRNDLMSLCNGAALSSKRLRDCLLKQSQALQSESLCESPASCEVHPLCACLPLSGICCISTAICGSKNAWAKTESWLAFQGLRSILRHKD
jgi:hypothetical protein